MKINNVLQMLKCIRPRTLCYCLVSPALKSTMLSSTKSDNVKILLNKVIHLNKMKLVFQQQQIVRSRRFTTESGMELNAYTSIVDNTLEEMADYFDCLADDGYFNEEYDCILADGVLTLHLIEHGTYVINKQTPNRQLWLSSPESGPKRYDFVENTWIYSHDASQTLHEFLSVELSALYKRPIDLTRLVHATRS